MLRKNRISFINLAGLAIGIAACLLVFIVIRNETEYDAWHSNRDHIYRIVTTTVKRSNGEVVERSGAAPTPLAEAVRVDFPQVDAVGAMVNAGSPQVYIPGRTRGDEQQFKETQGVFYAEPSIFTIFDFSWLAGNAQRLGDPGTVVLSQSLAEKYFGDWRNAIGKTIETWSWRAQYQVIGVFRDLPANTDIPIRMAMAYLYPKSARFLNNPRRWHDVNQVFRVECFVLAGKGQDMGLLSRQLPAFVEKYYQEDHDHSPTVTRLAFQPLRSMHLDDRFETYSADTLPSRELWSLGWIGVFLLLIACINYINLATAQAVNRAKEVGVRKVLGGDRRRLIRQFLGETALATFLALVSGYLLAIVALPYLSQLIGKPLSLSLVGHPSLLLFLPALGIAITLLAGFYPAVVLSGFRPVEAFRNKSNPKVLGGIPLRRGLVVAQFVIAQLLVIGTLVVIRQMSFFRNRPMGFDKRAIAIIDLPSDSADRVKYDYLKAEMLKIPGVSAASYCMDPPSSDEKIFNDMYFNNSTGKADIHMEVQFGDTAYLRTFGISLAAGRLPVPSDTVREFLVNTTAVRMLGVRSPEDIIGKTLSFNSRVRYPIVGVVRDFNSRSLRDPVLPWAFSTDAGAVTDLAIRIEPDRLVEDMTAVRKVFTRVIPSYLYDPVFFDEMIWQYYQKEAITSQLFKIFAALAIFISCLGLYGLVSFIVGQRTKEIGIRKVLGASVRSVLVLFSREFGALIGIAFLVAAPLGYYFMQRWLAGFYYHIDTGPGIFIAAVAISLATAACTMGYTIIKAASVNPARSLRTE